MESGRRNPADRDRQQHAVETPGGSRRSRVGASIRTRWKRWAAGLAGVILAFGLAWSVIAGTNADTFARTDPKRALGWQEHARALVALGEEELLAAQTAGDVTAIAALGRRAIVADPLDAGAIRLLGLVAEADGDSAAAARLMAVAGERSLRDTVAQLWLFQKHAASGEVGLAMVNADAVMRTRPNLWKDMLPPLISLMQNEDTRAPLVEYLGSGPPWRGWFLAEFERSGAPPAVVFDVLGRLKDGPKPIGAADYAPYLNQLIKDGEFDLAFLAWVSFLPKDQLAGLAYAYNGDFERPVSGLPFDWTIDRVLGAETSVAAGDRAEGGNALRVTFANRRVPFHHVQKLMLLTPDRYRLSGLVKAEGIENERGLWWRIVCAESGSVLAESGRVTGTTPWTAFQVEFDVPATGCTAQWLRLELAARVALETIVGGTIWYDDLAVTRASAGKPDGEG